MTMITMPARAFRSVSAPTAAGNNRTQKISVFHCAAGLVPPELRRWKEVNPREVKLTTATGKAIMQTLREEPEKFHKRNRGLTVSASTARFDDARQEVTLEFENPESHGVIDGGHTLEALLNVRDERLAAEDPVDPAEWPAFVFVKVFTGIEDDILDIAEGLNRSQQVDTKSLQNLQEHFEPLKKQFCGQPFEDKIAYKMNQDAPIDVREVLAYLGVFNADAYPTAGRTSTKHPIETFTSKEAVIKRFAAGEAAKQRGEIAVAPFDILTTRAVEILRLRDKIEERLLGFDIGRMNFSKPRSARNKKKSTRVRSKEHKRNPLHFIGKEVDGKVPAGWLMPILGAFRANVIWPKDGEHFRWAADPEELLNRAIDELYQNICDQHEQERRDPVRVGKSVTAWSSSFKIVQTEILRMQLEERDS